MKHAQLSALVADDDPISRGIVAEQLMRLRIGSVRTAGSGSSALKQLQADSRIGLLVTDLKMPDMDGIALLRELDDTLKRPVSVIIMSALGEKILRAAETIGVGHDLDVLGVASKPVSLRRLRDMLDRLPEQGPGSTRTSGGAPGQPEPEHIAEALENDGYSIVAQPEIEARSGKFVGVEILSRFSHAALAGFSAGEIIQAAESTPLIHDLLQRTIAQVGKAWKLWAQAGLSPKVSINLSHHNLTRSDLPDWLTTELSRHSLSPEDLILEITETAVPANNTINLEVAHRLGLRGFMLAIDDFGTGHANLLQLQNMPFTQLKIDKSFVDEIEDSFEARTIVESSLHMARNLGLKTVAEGVERRSQQLLLWRMGCDLMQGYLFARPMPVEQLPRWAGEYQPKPMERIVGQAA